MRYILASGSPRRRELMKEISEDFEVTVSDIDERALEEELEKSFTFKDMHEMACQMVRELSKRKALDVFSKLQSADNTVVIGADTTVALSDEILGKPRDRADAVRMLKKESMEHQTVYTGVTLVKEKDGKPVTRTFVEETEVIFKPLTPLQEERIEKYCDTDSPYDKAGAYGIQDESSSLVEGYIGDFSNIVGFPVDRVKRELESFIVEN